MNEKRRKKQEIRSKMQETRNKKNVRRTTREGTNKRPKINNDYFLFSQRIDKNVLYSQRYIVCSFVKISQEYLRIK